MSPSRPFAAAQLDGGDEPTERLDLRALKLDVGDRSSGRLRVPLHAFVFGGLEYVPVPLEPMADLTVSRLRDGWLFELGFAAHVEGPCHRCLEHAEVDVHVDLREYHAFAPAPGLEDEETVEYLEDGDLLNVGRWAADSVSLAMPDKILCREDCLGLCPTCGKDLNLGPCSCSTAEPDARWGKLKDLLPPDA